MAGLYLHIPFCQQACSYCDFYFSTRLQRVDEFVDAMELRIQQAGRSRWSSLPFRTLYLGGGTPSILSLAHVERLLRTVHQSFTTQFDEITFELNPENSSKEYLDGLEALGITRLSVGIQSLQPHILTFMHRAHDRETALRCLEELVGSRFTRWSADLILGNPGQTLDDVNADVTSLSMFEPPHISAYALMLEERTRLSKQVALGRIQMLDGDLVADQMHVAQSHLREAGYARYEVSSFAKQGVPGESENTYNRAVHNSRYWDHQPYLGLGPSAHSLWWDDFSSQASGSRWHEVKDLRAWLATVSEDPGEEAFQIDLEHLEPVTLAEERIMMALRTSEGLTFQELSNRYQVKLTQTHYDHIDQWIAHGWAVPGLTDRVRFTDLGLDRADALLLDLLSIPLESHSSNVSESLT
mgnify:FL=1